MRDRRGSWSFFSFGGAAFGSSLGSLVRAGTPGSLCMSVNSICRHTLAMIAVYELRVTVQRTAVQLPAPREAAI